MISLSVSLSRYPSNEEPSILRTKQPVSEVGVPEKFVDESVMEVDSVLRDSEPEIIRLVRTHKVCKLERKNVKLAFLCTKFC